MTFFANGYDMACRWLLYGYQVVMKWFGSLFLYGLQIFGMVMTLLECSKKCFADCCDMF
jgi:hypothetical protein